MKHFKIKRDEQKGIVHVVFDMAENRANIFNAETMGELSDLLDELAKDSQAKAVLFTSAKKGIFIAGADITMIKKLKSKDEAHDAARGGQNVFHKIAQLKVPTIAAINGACMGGGTEFSLACRFRVCSDSSKTKIGLPEVNLGILPGWGGTQRLPKLIGFVRSLDYLLSGKNFDSKSALKMSLVSDVFPELLFDEKVKGFVEKVASGAMSAPKRAKLSATESALEMARFTRKIALNKARATVMAKTQGHYPAPLKIIDVLDRSFGESIEKGLLIEAEAFSQLASTDICRNLIEIFLGSEEKKKVAPKNAQKTEKGAVLGAGVMGGGIAWAYANSGIPCVMKDITPEALATGLRSAKSVFASKYKRKKGGGERELLLSMGLIKPQLDFSGFNQIDVVIEAIVENLEVKRKVIGDLMSVVRDDCIVASNTSSLLITDIQQGLPRNQNIVGMHFFNPVHKMPLVEVIAGKHTDPKAVDTVVALTQKFGKIPIVVNDGPGFLVNRLLLPYMNEALWLVNDGVSIEQIDRACLKFGLPMGPIHLVDEVGIDVAFKVAKILHHFMPDRMPMCPVGEPVLKTGALGKKNGKGFYLYDSRGKKGDLNPEIKNFIKTGTVISDDDIIARVIYPLIREGFLALQDGIVSNARDLDLAMIFGTGFAPFRGGPARYADSIGCARIADKLGELSHKVSSRFAAPKGFESFKFYS